jgi:hypothetical protein
MTATTVRRFVATGLAAVGLAAAVAPAASADKLTVRTTVSVPAPYDASALYAGNFVDEAKGPVMLQVRNTITCVKGTARRAGYPKMCQWLSGLYGDSATLGAGQGMGDFYAAGVGGRPQGETFHAGTLRVGGVATDDWNVVVRGDDLREMSEVFHMSISATNAGSLVRDFTIMDND